MEFLKNFFKNQSTKAKLKSLGFMTSVFDNTIGKKRKDGGEIGFDKIVIYSLVIASCLGIIFKILNILEKYLPYIIIPVLFLIIFRKQLHKYVSEIIKKNNTINANTSPKFNQDLVKEKDNNGNSVVGNKITRDQAVKQIKEAKEMLDMGVLTKDEYDSLSKELKPIILGNKP